MWELSIISPQFPLPPAILPPSSALAELWIPTHPKGRALLEFPPFQKLRILRDILPITTYQKEGKITSRQLSVSELLRELEELSKILKTGGNSLPHRYWFGPYLEGKKAPSPLYSYRKLPTGELLAGFDLCAVNRNWDGNDRFEDLTERTELLDDIGIIPIVRQKAGQYLSGDLSNAIAVLNLLPPEFPIQLQLTHRGAKPQQLQLGIINVAEKARKRFGIPDYSEEQLQRLGELWRKMILRRGNFQDLALLLAAYFSEFIRIRIPGGYYERIDDLKKKKKPLEPSPFEKWRGVVLKLPFSTEQQLFSKIERAYFYRRPFPWELHYQSTLAQRQQMTSLLSLYSKLSGGDRNRFEASLRLILAIRDIRSYQLAAFLLLKEDEPAAVNSILELFLHKPPVTLPKKRLFTLALSEHPYLAAKALYIISLYWPELYAETLPKLMAQLPPNLHPLLTFILEKNPAPKELKKQLLKKLPPQKSNEEIDKLLKSGPKISPAPLLAECLESSSNPIQIETALSILTRYHAHSELEQVGQALADPDPNFRLRVFGLLKNSSDQQIIELLKSRALFESDPLCRKVLRQIDNQNEMS